MPGGKFSTYETVKSTGDILESMQLMENSSLTRMLKSI